MTKAGATIVQTILLVGWSIASVPDALADVGGDRAHAAGRGRRAALRQIAIRPP